MHPPPARHWRAHFSYSEAGATPRLEPRNRMTERIQRGFLVPYLERPWRRSLTPTASSVPRMMW